MSHPSELPEGFEIVKQRRTPALTKAARDRFEELLVAEGWQPGGTITRIAGEVKLTPEQVRDAIFAPSADEWRHGLTERINASRFRP